MYLRAADEKDLVRVISWITNIVWGLKKDSRPPKKSCRMKFAVWHYCCRRVRSPLVLQRLRLHIRFREMLRFECVQG
jgi:hypothetical protein